ncbi:ATP-binding protein [Streptomyces sp. NPDC056672]|uniref:HAMP domain-containing sensor histidine kinase n=1 Tax=Streptomyces sp. NPDC056672 TaxID=3345906 RepID=UPI0036D028E5
MRGVRPLSLRARLTCGLLVLLTVCCAVVGVVACVALRDVLTDRLDEQLIQATDRLPASLGSSSRARAAGTGQGDTRGQMQGTLGVLLRDGTLLDSAIVDAGEGTAAGLSSADVVSLAAVRRDGQAHSVRLSGVGSYRVVSVEGDDGKILITGLPLKPVADAARELQLVCLTVFGVALAITGLAGVLWIRRLLKPLHDVAAVATEITRLPLASGEVRLPPLASHTDPRTEVGAVGAALNRMMGHVEQALTQRQHSQERLRRFAADASHELRTPLAALRGYAELSLAGTAPVPAKVLRALRRIQKTSAHMGELVDELLLLARIDAGRPLARESVDLTLLALEGIEDARAAGPDHGWCLDLPDSPVVIEGDPQRLRQVVANLLANAHLHTPAGTRVTLSLRAEEDDASPPGADHRRGTVLLTVADDGPGVPTAFQAGIFDRFVRGDDRGVGAAAGSGLGLSIVAAVIEAHGGSVRLSSGPEATAFTVLLPVGEPNRTVAAVSRSAKGCSAAKDRASEGVPGRPGRESNSRPTSPS